MLPCRSAGFCAISFKYNRPINLAPTMNQLKHEATESNSNE
jgi:hypothetical protein